MKKKKYALALSGGGFKGAYQLGALRYMREHWKTLTGQEEFHIDLICGVSAGALNGILTACDEFDTLEKLWQLVHDNGGKEIYTSDYITNRGKIKVSFEQLKKDLLPGFKINTGLVLKGTWNSVRHLFDKDVPGLKGTILQAAKRDFNANFSQFKALAINKPLEKKLFRYVDPGKIPSDTLYRCGLVSLDDGNYYSFSDRDFREKDDFIHAILASTSMPIIWPPVPEINIPHIDKIITDSVDGGIRNISPLGDVVRDINADPDSEEYEVIIINCNSGEVPPTDKPWNIADIALRSLTEITLAEIFNNDVREFLKVNSMVKQAAKGGVTLEWKGRPKKHFDYTLIQPEGNELGDTLDSRPEMIEKRIQLGIEHAKKAFASAKA